MSDASLFDMPGPARRPKRTQGRPEWIPYRPVNPAKCSDCVLLLADSDGSNGLRASDARYRRRMAGVDTYYCAPHAHTRKAEDRGERT